MGTIEEAVQLDALRLEQLAEPALHAADRRFGEQPACNAGLIRHHDEPVAVPGDGAQRGPGVRHQPDPRRIDVVRDVLHERPVLVQEHRRPARHGHDDSRIGITITSGTTVSSGCVSTNRIVSATMAGSCSVPSSMSGKRSSRKGVRMPPATTAVTLTPTARPSTWSAWLKPSSPHLLA